MRQQHKAVAGSLIACIVALLIVVATFGFYFVTANTAAATTGSEVSSLKTASSEESGIAIAQQSLISQQQSVISCLQSEVTSLRNATNASASDSGSASTDNCTAATTNPLRSVNITGSLTVPSGTLQGSLKVTVWNGANVLITGISLNVTSSGLATNSGPPVFKYDNESVSISDPLPTGMTAIGNATLVSGTSGLYASYGYDFHVTIAFEDGITQTQTLYVQAAVQ